MLKVKAQQKQKNSTVYLEDNLEYVVQIVKQKYKVGYISHSEAKNKNNVIKLEGKPTKANI